HLCYLIGVVRGYSRNTPPVDTGGRGAPRGRSISTTSMRSIHAWIGSAGAGMRSTPPSLTRTTRSRSVADFVDELIKQILPFKQRRGLQPGEGDEGFPDLGKQAGHPRIVARRVGPAPGRRTPDWRPPARPPGTIATS